MTRTKKAARKRLANDRSILHANGSSSNTAERNRVADSYRPDQERDEAQLSDDDKSMQGASETENPAKRRKVAEGAFYRHSLRRASIRATTRN